jgi:polysaccharide deacetylase family protein (PEP-CTERM system associated)
MARPITFTFDLEDHRAPGSTDLRYPALTRRVLEFLDRTGSRGSFFVTGDVAEKTPDLVRDIAGAGHELGFHGWDHAPLPTLGVAQFREEAKRGKDLLEELGGGPVTGFRAPVFSLVPASRWAVDVLVEAGYRYSSSVLPARNPLFGDPRSPTRVYRWPNGLLELPCPVARVGSIGLPYLGGVYLRALPTALSRAAIRAWGGTQTLWIYCHPYDFDPDEPYWVAPEVGRLGSRLLWYNRRRALPKIEALLREGAAAPLGERLDTIASVGVREEVP